MAKKHTLKNANTPAAPKAAYTMPAPNDDMLAYGWQLTNIRAVDPKSEDKKDPDPGSSIFRAPQETMQTMRRIGHDAHFICPKYLQILLDTSPEVKTAALSAAEHRYTQESIRELQTVIMRVFTKTVLPDIEKNFEAGALPIAQFYAARVAHIKKFGAETGE
jgi:hypothetical protein